ncbi:hypothetical protein MMC27_000887 [Xylographa pallens]|nr:hypothetical protein [Xylographa pallens]
MSERSRSRILDTASELEFMTLQDTYDVQLKTLQPERLQYQRDHKQAFDDKTVLDFLSPRPHYPVFRCLCSYLGIAEIIALTRTCKKLSGLYQLLLKTQWKVDHGLLRFVKSPARFRSQMGQHSALVSGSFAVQFFERVTWEDSDLDIFVKGGAGAEAFGKYLIETEDYELQAAKEQEDYENDPMKAELLKVASIFLTPFRPCLGYSLYHKQVETYLRSDSLNSNVSKIQLVHTRSTPAQVILRGFYTTVVVNIISWNKAISIFPLPSFIRYKTYLLKAIDDGTVGPLTKYSNRGWRTQPILWPEEATSSHPIQATRRIGDKFSWTITFNTSNVQKSDVPDTVLDHLCFSLKKISPQSSGEVAYYSIQASLFISIVLKYEYTYIAEFDWPRDLDFFASFVAPRIEVLSRVELLKLGFQDIHRHHDAYLFLLQGKFVIPPSWPFYDDQIATWYSTWQQQKLRSSDLKELSWRIR